MGWSIKVGVQEYLDSLMALSKKVHRIVVLSIPTVHTLAHTGKQVNTKCSTLVMTSL